MKALLERLKLEGSVKVGVFGNSAKAMDSQGNTVGDIATFNELGLGVPKRSFIADFVDQNEGKIKSMIRALTKRIINGSDPRTELEIFGLQLVGEIQERISSGIPPENAESTKKKKQKGGGSTTPLINTGQLRSSITHLVEVK